MDVIKLNISTRRLALALLCAAVTGWFCASTLLLFDALLEEGIGQFLGGMVLFAIFGLPFALLATLIAGLPIMLVALAKGWTGRWHAALCGLGGGIAIWAGTLGYRLLTATGSWAGSQGYAWVDGWPTALGWQYELASAPPMALIGLASALVARWVAIPRADDRTVGE